MSHYEQLARELETIHDRRDELAPLIAHVRDDNYPKEALVQELLDARLGFFAYKLNSNYYDESAAEFAKHLTQLDADRQASHMAKAAAEEAATESEKKAEAPISQEPETPPASPAPETPEQPEETPAAAESTPAETPTVPSETQTPVADAPTNLPHCPSCAGFHVSHTEEHPYQIPDQEA